ncbi:Flagellar hook-basal body complex protein FliE [Lentibacillus sp. JNUCC-1]|uniref:flagellar hook-basal body complex protein FliE n=1 Tax=Lentibacillus sp. JNUCC-1 TaxID=2654513 RepID=UPI0012E86C42|nr:flagellar hook-basal body complex protein FliE [Lentibacillus sp. JNUCC-1]MUV39968.1 Flagellar hook-basal body complex protein FliE [Lentibacillus sp. JNUCC-1]
MKGVSELNNLALHNNSLQPTSPVKPEEKSHHFSELLKGAIETVNQAQNHSDQKTQALAAGKTDDLHDVMITAQKAGIMLETSVQIQQKAIDAYNEIMRMQI